MTVENHACSGGRAADLISPRTLDAASRSTPTPYGVSTAEQADAYLALFTMGGNDGGFSNIVGVCFALKSASNCQAVIENSRALLPTIKQALLDGIAGIRAAGLREDAKIVQLGYPYLQTDNNYTLPATPPYAAGDAVRSLSDDGTASFASVATDANMGHPGQMTFVDGVTEAFAGHEPDASTQAGNPDRWINQIGDGGNPSLWYHPNGLGQTAYAELLLKGGDYGATPSNTQPPATVRTIFRAKPVKRNVRTGDVVKIRTRVKITDGSRPRGKVLLRIPGKKKVAQAKVSANGRTMLRVKGLKLGRYRIKAVYVATRSMRSTAFTKVVVRPRR